MIKTNSILFATHHAAGNMVAQRYKGLLRYLDQDKYRVFDFTTKGAQPDLANRPSSHVMDTAVSRAIATHFGAAQKEACFRRKPCINLREETKWAELVTADVKQLAGSASEVIAEKLLFVKRNEMTSNCFWPDHVAPFITDAIWNSSN